MEMIEVPKAKLLETIRQNRDNHRAQFLEAQDKYRATVINELDKRLRAARDGGPINLGFTLPEPRDYTSSYDTVIAMLEWEMGDTVDLNEVDFQRYVLNKWEWANAFAASTAQYLG